jgi:hypothetical protein
MWEAFSEPWENYFEESIKILGNFVEKVTKVSQEFWVFFELLISSMTGK